MYVNLMGSNWNAIKRLFPLNVRRKSSWRYQIIDRKDNGRRDYPATIFSKIWIRDRPREEKTNVNDRRQP